MSNVFSTVAQAIRTKINNDVSVTPPILLVNEAPEANIDSSTGFIVLDINYGQSVQTTVGASGNNIARITGVIMLHVFLPIDEAVGESEAIADSLISALARKDFDGIITSTYTMSAEKAEDANGNGAFWRTTVMINFYYDEVI